MQKLLVKVEEAGGLASVGRTKAHELVASGEWPSVRIGKAVRVPLDGLREWIERQKQLAHQSGSDQ